MNVSLLNILPEGKKCFNRETAGGFGTAASIGNSFRAKIIEHFKGKALSHPIISFAYLAAIFSQKGHCVQYCENDVDKADLALISTSIIGFKREIEVAKKIKKRGIKVGFFGPFASVRPDLFLESGDFVIVGEPEVAALKISTGDIQSGIIEYKAIEDLDSLPFPNWDPFSIEDFSFFSMKKPFLTILSSRGCPGSCQYYCPYPLSQGNRWRARSVKNVVDEIKYLKNKYAINSLLFRDPMFSLDKERCKEISVEILKNNIQLNWGCETHLNFLDIDTLELMRQSGLKHIEVGIESTDLENLSKVHRRNASKSQSHDILNYCSKNGIRVVAFFLLGLPDQTKEDMQKTINEVKRLNIFAAQFMMFTPYPGTGFFKDIESRITVDDWQHYDGYTPVFEHKHLSATELLQIKEHAWISYYYRPKTLFRLIRGY